MFLQRFLLKQLKTFVKNVFFIKLLIKNVFATFFIKIIKKCCETFFLLNCLIKNVFFLLNY
jgi:hypothetical protein